MEKFRQNVGCPWLTDRPVKNVQKLFWAIFAVVVVSLVQNPIAEAASLINGGVIKDGIMTPGGEDSHTFSGTKGENVQIRVADTSETDFTPRISLYDPSGGYITYGQGYTTGAIERTLPASGTYTVVVADVSSGQARTGTYDLYFVRAPGANEGGVLPNGGVRSDTIDVGDLDSYTFSGTKGENVLMRVTDTSETDFTPRISLYDPSGGYITYGQGYTTGAIERTLPASGTYTVVVADVSSGQARTGAYDLYFVRAPGANEGGVLPNGGVRSDTIDVGDLDSYTFPGTKGENVLMRVTDTSETDFTPRITLYDPSGGYITYGQGYTTGAIERTLPASGTYTVVVADVSSGLARTGTYDLYFVRAPGANEGGVLPNGGVHSDTIDVGDLDSYTFSGTKGDVVNIEVTDTSETDFTPRITLYDPSGGYITYGQGYTTGVINRTLPASGTYTVVVADVSSGLARTGTYDLAFNTTGTCPAPPAILTPVPGSTLTTSTVTFTGGHASDQTDHWFSVGTSPGEKDLYDSGSLGTSPTATVSGLPTNGMIYVQYWTRNRCDWVSQNHIYTMNVESGPDLTSPTPESTLAGSSTTFEYEANGTAVTEWWLWVGKSKGTKDLYSKGSGDEASQTVSGLPTDGRTLHVRLWYKVAGQWLSRDFIYTAHTSSGGTVPAITTPAPGSTFGSGSVTFEYTAKGEVVTEWRLSVGSSVGGTDLHESGSLGTTTSHTVSGLPTDGRTLHVRLGYKVAGTWLSKDATYTAHTETVSTGEPALTTPAPGSTFGGATVTFAYTAKGAAVTEWWLYVGSSQGTKNLYSSGSLSAGTTNKTVFGLPTNGSTVHVRLWYKVAGIWLSKDATYTAHTETVSTGEPALTTPAPGSTFGGATVPFAYTANGAAVTEWWLYVGSSQGAKDLYTKGAGSATSQTVTGLPTDGRTLYVRLWYKVAGTWLSKDATYTAHTETVSTGEPALTTPAPGSTFGGATVTFAYTANGAAVTEWWLYVGSSQGTKNLYSSGSLSAGTTNKTVFGLPTNGSTVHVRLWYKVAGIWLSKDATYTAS